MSELHYVEADDLSVAWVNGLNALLAQGGEAAPLIVSVTGFDGGVVRETASIRSALEATLLTLGMQSCHTVANTIFPLSLWQPSRPRQVLFDRYGRLLPRLHRASRQNTKGLYFERLIRGGPATHPNQLDFVLSTYAARAGVRRSVLQLAVFDAARDQTAAARQGFPCLQHVTFAPHAGGLSINAFYSMHYFIERAYGNYLGLCRLGQFAAHELGLPLTRMTCFAGIAQLGIAKNRIASLLTALRMSRPGEAEGDEHATG